MYTTWLHTLGFMQTRVAMLHRLLQVDTLDALCCTARLVGTVLEQLYRANCPLHCTGRAKTATGSYVGTCTQHLRLHVHVLGRWEA